MKENNMKTFYSESQLDMTTGKFKRKKFNFKFPSIRKFLQKLFYKSIGFKWASITVVNPCKWTDEFIIKTLKTNGFIELNRRGYFFINGFTMIELLKGDTSNGIKIAGHKPPPENEHITTVKIKHDIDSATSEPVKEINIECKVTNLQNMIDYFNKL